MKYEQKKFKIEVINSLKDFATFVSQGWYKPVLVNNPFEHMAASVGKQLKESLVRLLLSSLLFMILITLLF